MNVDSKIELIKFIYGNKASLSDNFLDVAENALMKHLSVNRTTRIIELSDAHKIMGLQSFFIGSIDQYRYKDKTHGSSREELTRELFFNGFSLVGFNEDRKRTCFVAYKREIVLPENRKKTLSVIITAYNEVSSVYQVVNSVLEKQINDLVIDVILVEGNSSDGTRKECLKFVDNPRVNLILEKEPQGKGFAVRTGLSHSKSDFILIQDADTEYEVDDYDNLLKPLLDGTVSFVLGSRQKTLNARFGIRHFEDAILVSWIANFAHHCFRTLFNVVYRTKLRDPFTMYKVFRRDCILGLTFSAKRFDFDWEIVGKLIRRGIIPFEVPVSYHSRSFKEGKKIRAFRDPPMWLISCFRFKFQKMTESLPGKIER